MLIKQVTWPILKSAAIAKVRAVHWLDYGDRYWVALIDDIMALEVYLNKNLEADSADVLEFETTYKSTGNKTLAQRYHDGRVVGHTTPRKRGLITNFTARDDDQADHMRVGGGANVLASRHLVGDPPVTTIYFDLNTIANETHLHSGTIQWENAKLDILELTVIPKTTVHAAGTGTNYNLFGGYLIIPAAPGTGTTAVADADRVLVQIPLNEFGDKAGAGYWDATFNTTTKLFENIQPNYAGTGSFNMFGLAVTLDRFVHHQLMLGSGNFTFHSSDASMLGHGLRLKLMTTTVGTDHEWSYCISLILHRKKTI